MCQPQTQQKPEYTETPGLRELMSDLNFITDAKLEHLQKCMDDVMGDIQKVYEAIENIRATRREAGEER